MKLLGRGTLSVVAVVAMGGCAGLGNNFKAPDVLLDHVVVRGLGITGGTLDLVMNVYNPNNFDLQGTKLRVGLEVEKAHVGDIAYNNEFLVRKQDTTQVTLPITFQWAGIGGAARAALGYGDLPYTIKGEAQLTTPFGRQKVPFSRSGRAPLTSAGGKIVLPGTP